MSYSRWGSRGSGHWYCYWCAPIGRNEETYNNAKFEICMMKSFTARELRNDMDRCISMVDERDPNAGTEKLEELKIYMNEFLADIEHEYREKKECFM